MKIDWKRAIVAGIAGTIAFDVLGLLITGAGQLRKKAHWAEVRDDGLD